SRRGAGGRPVRARPATRLPLRGRRGAAAVEAAVVAAVFLLLLSGVFEYCRFMFVLHVTNNAARDAARYAAVRVSCPPDQVAATRQAVLDYATARMGGVQKHIDGYRVAVYAVDPAGLDLTPAVVRPKSLRPPAYPDPFDPADPNAVPWNSV